MREMMKLLDVKIKTKTKKVIDIEIQVKPSESDKRAGNEKQRRNPNMGEITTKNIDLPILREKNEESSFNLP